MRSNGKPPKINTISFGFLVKRGPQKTMAAADQHNEIELNFVEAGEILLRIGTETVKLTPGLIAIYWAAIPHQVIAVKPQTEISWIALPLSQFLAWQLPEAFTKNIFNGEILILEYSKIGFRAPSFSDWAADFARSLDLRSVVKLEVEAFFRRLAAEPSPKRAPKARATTQFEPHQCLHVERMLSLITERFREPLSVKDIARGAGLAPEYAMRLFRNRWGVTLWTFLLRQRITEAKRLLVLSDTPLAEIAFACGFQSLGRFYHAFKTQCGCSPGAYRRLHTATFEPTRVASI